MTKTNNKKIDLKIIFFIRLQTILFSYLINTKYKVRALMVPDGPIKTCQIWLLVVERFDPKKVVKKIPNIG